LGRNINDCVQVLSGTEEVEGLVSSVFKFKSTHLPSTISVIVALSLWDWAMVMVVVWGLKIQVLAA
jgi:hypothetical protein